MTHAPVSRSGLLLSALIFCCPSTWAQAGQGTPENAVRALRATSPVVVDGDLDDPVWQAAAALTTFYEVYPRDRAAPDVDTEVRFAFDDEHVYIAARMHDVNPSVIRSPFVRRDRVAAGQDYVQFFIDPFGTRRAAEVFRVNVRGNQTDGTVNEATGTEDDAPDFSFDVATRRSADGWQAELRIPWSSLRYPPGSRGSWAIMAYRGWPRQDNTQIASGPVARAATCFMCFATRVDGIETPPRTTTLLVAPSVVVETADAVTSAQAGADISWRPTGNLTIDATLNPDFSELEADAPQVTGNARYALKLIEKRAFFLESADLLETPLPFIYTRSIADPSAGLRVTERNERFDLTGWIARDEAGGRLTLPGPYASRARTLDASTDVTLGRARLNLARFSVALDWAGRRGDEYRNRDYSNSVGGIDVAWQPGDSDRIAMQWLHSDTVDPSDPQRLAQPAQGSAWRLQWEHLSERLEWTLRDQQIDAPFRADVGFIPTADWHEQYAELGARWFDIGIFNEITPYLAWANEEMLSNGAVIARGAYPAVSLQGERNLHGFIEFHLADEARAADGLELRRTRFVRFDLAGNPWPRWPKLRLYGDVGRLLDVETGELRDGYELTSEVLLRPIDRFELYGTVSRLRLQQRDGGAVVASQGNESLTGVWHFSADLNARLECVRENARRSAPAVSHEMRRILTLVVSYRPDWRTTAFVGLSRIRSRTDVDSVAPDDPWRVFLKLRRSFGG